MFREGGEEGGGGGGGGGGYIGSKSKHPFLFQTQLGYHICSDFWS